MHVNDTQEGAWTFDLSRLCCIRGAASGEGLGNNFLSHIAAVDGIFHVMRAFEDPDVIHVEDRVDPVADLDIIHRELRLKDIERMESVLQVGHCWLHQQGWPAGSARGDWLDEQGVAGWMSRGNYGTSVQPWLHS